MDRWSLQILNTSSPPQVVSQIFHRDEEDMRTFVEGLAKMPRPLLLTTETSSYWLLPGDILLAVPVLK